MQREILFKAIRNDKGQWVEGMPQYLSRTGLIDGIQEKGGFVWEVDPETVCQYTCLKYKTLSNAFEGDKIMWQGIEFVICWIDGCFWAISESSNNYWKHHLYDIINDCEVIGNIHDKKEVKNG